MRNEQILAEIREANMTYLMLAQTLIRQDKAEALFRLGMSEEAADLIGALSPAQIMRIASGNMLLCRFRVDDDIVWNLLTNHSVNKVDNDATTKLHMKVPLHFHGDELSPAVKTDGCIANHVLTEIEVLCLPTDLPEFIKVDLSGLKKGSSLHLNDIAMPKGVTAVTHGKNNPVVVSVVAVAGAAEAAPAAAAPAAEGAPAKGGKPAAKAAPAAKPAAKK